MHATQARASLSSSPTNRYSAPLGSLHKENCTVYYIIILFLAIGISYVSLNACFFFASLAMTHNPSVMFIGGAASFF